MRLQETRGFLFVVRLMILLAIPVAIYAFGTSLLSPPMPIVPDEVTVLVSPQIENFWYRFPIEQVTKITDGDTFVCDIDMGMNIHLRDIKIRVLGCDAYELRTPKGPEAKEFAKQFLQGGFVTLYTYGEYDNFGRLLAVPSVDGVYLSDALTSAGLTTARFRERLPPQ